MIAGGAGAVCPYVCRQLYSRIPRWHNLTAMRWWWRSTAAGRGALVAMAVLAACTGSLRGGAPDIEAFRRDVREICACGESRVLGSAGFDATVNYVRRRIAELDNVELREQTWPVLVPVTRRAELVCRGTDGTAVVHRIYPFWPASVRVNSTPAGGISGELAYLGDGGYGRIPGDLRGRIAVMESTAGASWTQAFCFGAAALLVLGNAGLNHIDLRAHDLPMPINLPRFFVPDGALADDLRAGRIRGRVTLLAEVAWEKRNAVNLYALVRPGAPAPAERASPSTRGAAGDPAALMITAGLDATGLVPDLACGASQAVQPAAALAVLRSLSARPPARPVVVFFAGGDGIQLRATREMMMTLIDPPSVWREQLEGTDLRNPGLTRIERDLARDLSIARAITGDPGRLDPVGQRSLAERLAQIIDLDAAMAQDELFRLRTTPVGLMTDALRLRERELDALRMDLSALSFAVRQNPRALRSTWLPSAALARQQKEQDAERASAPDEVQSLLPAARRYLARAIDRMERLGADCAARRRHLETRMELYRWLAQRLGRQEDPRDRADATRLIDTIVTLDLSDRGGSIGPMFYGNFLRVSSLSQIQEWRLWFERQKKSPWMQALGWRVDLDVLSGARAPATWLAAPLAMSCELGMAWGVPAFALATLNDLRLRRDTPADTLENLDLDAVVPQLEAACGIIRRAADDPGLRTRPEYKRHRTSISGQVVSAAAGRPVPDLPREGFVATYFYADNRKAARPRNIPWTLGVRRNEIVPTDADGRYVLEGLSRVDLSERAREYLAVSVQVFMCGADGAIIACSDVGRQSADIRIHIDVRQDLDPLRSVVFSCEELALAGLYDPRYLQDLGELTLLDARRNAEPQRYNYFIFRQLMAGFVEPAQACHFLFRLGRAGNRLVLLNTGQTDGAGRPRGFTAHELGRIGPLAMVSAADFHELDSRRIRDCAARGVRSELVDNLHAEAARQLEKARAALAGGNVTAAMRAATAAWSDEARVYAAARDMANDVIRGAIFLLLLTVPFAFCMERLLIASPDIYRQIAGAAAVFAVMTAALASFHPAFRISSSPLIIILAFGIMFMSAVVIRVVYGKFDTELKRIRSGRGTDPAAGFARASVLLSAVLLGIANMRKRPFRTALTAITVVLITFAVLCFTSASRHVGIITLPAGVPSSYPGVMLRQRGFRPIPQAALENLRAVLNVPGEIRRDIPGHRVIVEHWWNVSADDPREHVQITAGLPTGGAPRTAPATRPAVRSAPVAGVLGLSPGQSRLCPIAQVVPGFDLLESGRNDVIYLSRDTAARLAVRAGEPVRVAGMDLVVGGVFDPADFDARIAGLSGQWITPLDYQSSVLDAGGRPLRYSSVEDVSLDAEDAAAELGGMYEHLSSAQVAIVPAAVARMLPNAALRAMEIRLADQEEVKKVGAELARRMAMAIFAGYDDGVRMIAAGDLTEVHGGAMVAVPLAIAALIIFNTMMGSIAERRREIHVYTSLGLAPMHVGALFLAEAMTYGLIGTVFGYIIGQGAGRLMMQLGWLGDVTLNYSGTGAMLTMGLILTVVLLSALVPARVASRIAAPSIERTWRVPLPKDDEIHAPLPFTINKTAADGILAYLAEYFDAHREGSIGRFSAGPVDCFVFPDEKGRLSRGLKTVVWLAPYDLGVRQHLLLLVHPGQYEDIYEVQVILQRLSGDDGSWYRLNRPFLTDLRRQFLMWRSLTPQRMMDYVRESARLIAG